MVYEAIEVKVVISKATFGAIPFKLMYNITQVSSVVYFALRLLPKKVASCIIAVSDSDSQQL